MLGQAFSVCSVAIVPQLDPHALAACVKQIGRLGACANALAAIFFTSGKPDGVKRWNHESRIPQMARLLTVCAGPF